MSLKLLNEEVIACVRCPRLVVYRSEVAVTKRRAFLDWTYWGRPIPSLGDPAAQIWIIGLAPAAHGANRTGRMFTGDNSGNFLFASLYRCGLANQPKSISRDDGLALNNCFISATARCAPPDNKPLPEEVSNCSEYLDREWRLLKRKRAILALGAIAWNAALALAARNGCKILTPKAPFRHGAELELCEGLTLVGSYHVSQQNTFTRKG